MKCSPARQAHIPVYQWEGADGKVSLWTERAKKFRIIPTLDLKALKFNDVLSVNLF